MQVGSEIDAQQCAKRDGVGAALIDELDIVKAVVAVEQIGLAGLFDRADVGGGAPAYPSKGGGDDKAAPVHTDEE